jgi:hypothetical protein
VIVRALRLAPLVFLAGCVATAGSYPAAPPQVASIGEVELSLEEMDDVPVDAQILIVDEFDHEAFTRRIKFDAPNPSIEIKGYVTVVASGAGTLFIYVFDFEDRSGRRLLRVGGRVSTPETPADPWAAFDRHLADQIVDHVFDEFDAWLAENAVGA